MKYSELVNIPFPNNLMKDVDKDNKGVSFETVEREIYNLNDRERKAVLLRYRDHKTLEDVGVSLNVQTERARQIILKAIRRLRFRSKCGYMHEASKAYPIARELVDFVKHHTICMSDDTPEPMLVLFRVLNEITLNPKEELWFSLSGLTSCYLRDMIMKIGKPYLEGDDSVAF